MHFNMQSTLVCYGYAVSVLCAELMPNNNTKALVHERQNMNKSVKAKRMRAHLAIVLWRNKSVFKSDATNALEKWFLMPFNAINALAVTSLKGLLTAI